MVLTFLNNRATIRELLKNVIGKMLKKYFDILALVFREAILHAKMAEENFDEIRN